MENKKALTGIKQKFLDYVKDKPWTDEPFINKGLKFIEDNLSITEEEIIGYLKEIELENLNFDWKKTFLAEVFDKPWYDEGFIKRGLHYFEQEPPISVLAYDRKFKELKKENDKISHFKRIKNKKDFFEIALFYPVGNETIIRIKSKYGFLPLDGQYKAMVTPYYDFTINDPREYFEVNANDNIVEFPYTFKSEQQYWITLFLLVNNEEIPILGLYVYALESDLYQMKYLKGDLHTHTTCSDGFETPELLISLARKKGLDFVAITDHNSYRGSVEGEIASKRLGNKIVVIRGEEYYLSYNPMHILSLGAPKGLDLELYGRKILELDETRNIEKEHAHSQFNVKAFAGVQVLFDKIRENGGISIICHPLWKPGLNDKRRLDVPYSLLFALFKEKRFDGIEVVSGSGKNELDTTNLQDLLFREIGVKYDDMAVIGVTDSHCYSTSDIAGLHYTIVFSNDRDAESIVDAIRNYRTVAVAQTEKNGTAQCYGSLRYAQFAQFLIKYYFPEQDEIAFVEGKEMLDKINQWETK